MADVSFIIPAYKGKYLRKAIESILAQTCRDFELVVVDDASPEDLESIVAPYVRADRRVRYCRNEKNFGADDLTEAWMRAVARARGTWCVLAGDDDVYEPGYLEEMIRLRMKYPSCDLVHSRLAVIDANGTWTGGCAERLELESPIQMLYARGVCRVDQSASEFMFRKAAFEKVGGFVRLPRAWYADDATWLLLAGNGCACSQQVLCLWRQSGDNVSLRFDDLVAKMSATESYKRWIARQIGRMRPATEEERRLHGLLLPGVCHAADGLCRWQMNQLKLLSWLRVLRVSPLSRALKRKFVWDRLRLPYWPGRQ